MTHKEFNNKTIDILKMFDGLTVEDVIKILVAVFLNISKTSGIELTELSSNVMLFASLVQADEERSKKQREQKKPGAKSHKQTLS